MDNYMVQAIERVAKALERIADVCESGKAITININGDNFEAEESIPAETDN
jgi:hypothetical protein